MKKLTGTITLLLATTLLLCGQTNGGITTMADDRAAIIEVIESEQKYFSQRDFDKYATTFVHTDNVYWGDGITYTKYSWQALAHHMQTYMANNPEPVEPQEYFNYDIKIVGNKAWALFNKRDKGETETLTNEHRILVKEDGKWKIKTLIFFTLHGQ